MRDVWFRAPARPPAVPGRRAGGIVPAPMCARRSRDRADPLAFAALPSQNRAMTIARSDIP